MSQLPSGYAVSEAEFVGLLHDPVAGPRLQALLDQWGLSLDLDDAGSVAGVHRAIQGRPDQQRAVYQVAMDLWR